MKQVFIRPCSPENDSPGAWSSSFLIGGSTEGTDWGDVKKRPPAFTIPARRGFRTSAPGREQFSNIQPIEVYSIFTCPPPRRALVAGSYMASAVAEGSTKRPRVAALTL